MNRILSLLFAAACMIQASAQTNRILADNIRSLQVVADDDWQSLPVVRLNEGKIDIDFDDLTHRYERYTYRIDHCDADWSVSEALFASDYLEGFAEGNTIDDVAESINTNEQYTHYHLSLPGDKCRLKLSGNYRLTVFRDNDNSTPVLEACFMVVDPKMSVSLELTSNTDRGNNSRWQQIGMQVGYGSLNVTNPQVQLHTVVMQNRQWHDARIDVRQQFTMADGLRWQHCPDYIFEGGNAYHKFEILSTDHPSMGIESIEWDGTSYHAYPYLDTPRRNYVYDESAQGAFYLRNSDNSESQTTSDYMNVHFRLKCDAPAEGDVYLNGDWTRDEFSDTYKAEYDAKTHTYSAVVPLKLGYYSYQYLVKTADGRVVYPPFEGSFHETANTYQALIYYRPTGGRTDLLVGYASLGR